MIQSRASRTCSSQKPKEKTLLREDRSPQEPGHPEVVKARGFGQFPALL